MRRVAAARSAVSRLIIVEGGDNVEWVQSPILGVSDVDDLAMEVAGQLLILIFRVENKNLRVVRREIRQDTFGRVGLTGAGLAHDDHVGVDAL